MVGLHLAGRQLIVGTELSRSMEALHLLALHRRVELARPGRRRLEVHVGNQVLQRLGER